MFLLLCMKYKDGPLVSHVIVIAIFQYTKKMISIICGLKLELKICYLISVKTMFFMSVKVPCYCYEYVPYLLLSAV